MALERISYIDKIALEESSGVEMANKITDIDMNQIKSVVNAVCTSVDLNEENVDTLNERVELLETKTSIKSIIDVVYPIGSIYISYSSTNPGTSWPGTTWVREADGKCIIGVGTGYDSAGLTGGSTTVTLATTQIPSHTHTFTGSLLGTHNHTQNAHGHTQVAHSHTIHTATDSGMVIGYVYTTGWNGGTIRSNANGQSTINVGQSTPGINTNTATNNAISAGTPSGTNSATGGSGAHSNMQPYITMYIWKRTG